MSGSKVEGYVLNLPGAPNNWHLVEGLGYVHPDIPVPLDAKDFYAAHQEQVDKAATAWDELEADQEAKGNRQHGRLPFEKPDPPVKRVRVSEAQLEKGREALADHLALSRRAVRQARSGSPEEQVQAHEESAALAAGQEG